MSWREEAEVGQKYNVTKASDYKYMAEVEVNTLDDLKNLSAIHGCSQLIISFAFDPKSEWEDNHRPSIIIYDDYVE